MNAGWKEFTPDDVKNLVRIAINLRSIKVYVYDDDEFLGYPCEEGDKIYLVSQGGEKKLLDFSKYAHFDCCDYDNWRGDQINLWTQEEWEKEEQYMRPDSLSFCIGGDDVFDVINTDFITIRRIEEFGENLSQNLAKVWPFGTLSRPAVELILKALDLYVCGGELAVNDEKGNNSKRIKELHNAEKLKNEMELRLEKALKNIKGDDEK